MTTSMSQKQVLAKFSNRCILCGRKTVVLHEIIPKSQLPKTWNKKGNRIPLCMYCHNTVHSEGAALWVNRLSERRDKITNDRKRH